MYCEDLGPRQEIGEGSSTDKEIQKEVEVDRFLKQTGVVVFIQAIKHVHVFGLALVSNHIIMAAFLL